MSRSLVGVLAAIGAVMAVIAGLTRGALFWTDLVAAALATGLAACLASSPTKKSASQPVLACIGSLKLAHRDLA